MAAINLVMPMMIHCSTAGPVIKAAIFCSILCHLFVTPVGVSAESVIQGDVINAPNKIEKSGNIAAGSDNQAVHSSIAVKNSRINSTIVNSGESKSAMNVAAGKRNVAGQSSVAVTTSTVKGTLSNTSTGKNMQNAAVGNRNQANQSATVIKNSSINATLSNTSKGEANVNMAIGADNKADQGSVRIENSKIRGTVANTSVMQKSTNMAMGTGNSASQAAIVMDGTKLRGLVANTASGENGVNVAAGYRNEASQGSIVVDGGGQAGIGSEATLHPNTLYTDVAARGQEEHVAASYTGRKRAQDSEEQKAARHVPGQVIFLIDNDKAGLAGLDRVAQKYHLNVDEKTLVKSLDRIMVVSSTTKDATEIAGSLKKESGIYNPQPNYVFSTMGREDPLSSMQNLVSMLDLQEVHGKVTGRNITVAVVDTGVEVAHEDLRHRIVGHQNFISSSAYQGEIHGTAVAGIIGADKNECGIVGIAPDVSLLALRACRQVKKSAAMGECFSTSLVRSLDAAISAKVDVVNLSLGAYVNDTLLGMMIDSGHGKGIVFAAPVGNDPAAENMAFPASHDKVISVAGLDERGNPLPNKYLASMADAVAPATHLFVTSPGNGYNYIDGTSLASASISGIIALSMEKKIARNSPCLPRFKSALPWPQQVFSCIGL